MTDNDQHFRFLSVAIFSVIYFVIITFLGRTYCFIVFFVVVFLTTILHNELYPLQSLNQKLPAMLLVTAFTQQILTWTGQWECFTSMFIAIYIRPSDTAEYGCIATEKDFINYKSVHNQTYV